MSSRKKSATVPKYRNKEEHIEWYEDAGEELKKIGIYYITGPIEQDSLLEIQQDMLIKHMDPAWKDDIQIIVNSVGGSITEAWALIDLMDFVKMDIRTIGMGEVASAGASILCNGTKGKRVVAKNCSIMVHGVSTELMRGNHQQLVSQMKWVHQEHNRDIQFWIKRSKYTTKKQVEKAFLDGTDKYITPVEAKKHGIIDIIIGEEEDE